MALVICAVMLVLTLVGPAAASKKRASAKKRPLPAQKPPSFSPDVQNELRKYLGIRYRLGGRSMSGVDCSGFVSLVYRNLYGVTDLHYQSASLYASSSLQRVPMGSLNTGDLIYFTSSRRSKRINHVGIYLSEGKFIHASRGKGVVVSSLDDPYWRVKIAGANRLPGLESRYKGARPVPNSKTALAADIQDFPLTFLSIESSSSAYDAEASAPPQIVGQSVGLELGFANGLLPFQLTMFRESLPTWRVEEFTAPLSSERGYLGTGERTALTPVHGIRLGSDIRPFEWLSLSPSLTYFKYDSGIDDSGLPRHSMGLDMTVGSVKDGWMLSTGFRYSSLTAPRKEASLLPAGSPMEEYDSQHALDMSLTLMQRISNNLSISIVGERIQRLGVAPSESSRDEKDWDERRFSLMFSFSY